MAPEDPANRANTFIIPQNDLTAGMEPMTNYIADLAEYPDGVITKYDFTTAKVELGDAVPINKFDDSQTVQYVAGKSFRDLHVITLPEIFL